MKDFLGHYDTIIEAFYSVTNQNKMLFEFISMDEELIEQWNAFYKANYEE